MLECSYIIEGYGQKNTRYLVPENVLYFWDTNITKVIKFSLEMIDFKGTFFTTITVNLTFTELFFTDFMPLSK